jgi:hypothetical protein
MLTELGEDGKLRIIGDIVTLCRSIAPGGLLIQAKFAALGN